MEKYKLVLLLLVAVCWSCQKNDNEQADVGEPASLKGTQWKLAGIVDTGTGSLKVLKPEDCEKCYMLAFDTDSTFSTYSSVNELGGDYVADYEKQGIHFIRFGGTKLGEIGDGYLWWEIFPNIESFLIEKDELKLYYADKKNFLLFKPQQ